MAAAHLLQLNQKSLHLRVRTATALLASLLCWILSTRAHPHCLIPQTTHYRPTRPLLQHTHMHKDTFPSEPQRAAIITSVTTLWKLSFVFQSLLPSSEKRKGRGKWQWGDDGGYLVCWSIVSLSETEQHVKLEGLVWKWFGSLLTARRLCLSKPADFSLSSFNVVIV